MANGYPIAALAGKAEYMDRFAPGRRRLLRRHLQRPPGRRAAALATIAVLEDGTVHEHCFAPGRAGGDWHRRDRRRAGHPDDGRSLRLGVRALLHGRADRHATPTCCATTPRAMSAFRQGMCERGIFMMPTALKRNHISAAHTEADIDRTLEVARQVLRSIAS